ncbi:hypothetical protein FRC11_008628, partial [Ceratobasidium sp. 423]
MPTANVLSNPRTLRKGKGCGSLPPAPKKKPSRKKGVLKWTNGEYLHLYCKISMILLKGNNEWDLVNTQHSDEGPTDQSLEGCKNHWFP